MNTIEELRKLNYAIKIVEFVKSLKRQIEARDSEFSYAPTLWKEGMTERELIAIKRAEKLYKKLCKELSS